MSSASDDLLRIALDTWLKVLDSEKTIARIDELESSLAWLKGKLFRVPALDPFVSTSPWKTSMGQAVFEDTSAPKTARFLSGTAQVNSSNWSIALFQAKDTDPLVTLTDTSKSPLIIRTVYMPAETAPTTGLDKSVGIIQPDGITEVDCYKFTRATPTAVMSTFVNVIDLTGTGLTGGSRAAGVAAVGGLIRKHELENFNIPHAITISIPMTMLKLGQVWPARSQDRQIAPTATSAGMVYSGPIPMGSMVGIPASVDLSKLVLSSEGLALARALQQYGGYVLDQSTTVAIYAEPASDQTAVARMKTDWQRAIYPLLRIITNSTASNISGGEPRLLPAALPFIVSDPR